jgi:hypothetical protein
MSNMSWNSSLQSVTPGIWSLQATVSTRISRSSEDDLVRERKVIARARCVNSRKCKDVHNAQVRMATWRQCEQTCETMI